MSHKITEEQIQKAEQRIAELKSKYAEQRKQEQRQKDKTLAVAIRDIYKNIDNDEAIIEQVKKGISNNKNNNDYKNIIARLVAVEEQIASAENGNTIPKDEYNNLKKQRHNLIAKLK